MSERAPTNGTGSGAGPRVIAIVATSDVGVFHFRGDLVGALVAQGHEVHVITPPGEAVESIRALGASFVPWRLDRGSMNPASEFSALSDVLRILRRIRPDLLLTFAIKAVIYGGAAARLLGIPAVAHTVSGLGYTATATGVRGAVLRGLIRGVYAYSLRHRNQRVVFLNHENLEQYVEDGLVRRDDAMLLNGEGVDTNLYRPTPAPDGVPVVMLLSRMLWEKGIPEFVEAAKIMRQEGTSVRCVLVGGTDEANPESIPESQLRQWTAEGSIEWLGWQDDILGVFARASIVCLPTNYAEGLPRTLLEAAACGRPIVASDAPGCREIVKEGVNGLLVAPRDTRALAQALTRLVDDPEERARMGAQGRTLVLQAFSSDIINRRLLDLYHTLLSTAK